MPLNPNAKEWRPRQLPPPQLLPDHHHPCLNNGVGNIVEAQDGIRAVEPVRLNPNPINKRIRRPALPPRHRRTTTTTTTRPPAVQAPSTVRSHRAGGYGHSSRRSSSAARFSNPNTTVMIKNIPNQIRRDFMLSFLDDCCRTWILEYDFLYLPIDFRKGYNLGYGFVNFTTAKAARKFWNVLQNYKWGRVYTHTGPINSRKICQIRWARVQGKEALVNKFQNSKFECSDEDFLPVVLEPPRNGWNSNESIPKVMGNMSVVS